MSVSCKGYSRGSVLMAHGTINSQIGHEVWRYFTPHKSEKRASVCKTKPTFSASMKAGVGSAPESVLATTAVIDRCNISGVGQVWLNVCSGTNRYAIEVWR